MRQRTTFISRWACSFPALATAALLALSCATPAAAPPAAPPPPQASSPAAPQPMAEGEALVARMWHGRTPAAKAEEYTRYLNEAGIKKISAIQGNLGVQMFRRLDGDAADFYVISYWRSRDAIRAFAGEDIGKTHPLPRDPEYLLELEPYVKHFDVIVNEWKR
jgi:heme-degrading monooxygenase HmoA